VLVDNRIELQPAAGAECAADNEQQNEMTQ
jgi:hypothetical protein